MTNVISRQHIAVVPAAGVGKRMKSVCPKQYLTIGTQTVLEHTVNRLLAHPKIDHVVIALGKDDGYYSSTSLPHNPNVTTVVGGKERADSVLAGLKAPICQRYSWVLVHDAARPCVTEQDISALILACEQHNQGGLLALPVRDTMKRGDNSKAPLVKHTVERENLWHALTPQMYPAILLREAIENALTQQFEITDEASAFEFQQLSSQLIEGRGDNIKITRPDDLALAEFIIRKQANSESAAIQASLSTLEN